jgi:hypothetical protein
MRAAIVPALCAAATALWASAAAAQTPGDAPAAAFLPRADFSLAWAGLVADDPRFDWSGVVALGLDLADYGSGRLTFAASYEGILGRERRRYDLNQGSYSFETGVSYRTGRTEVVGLLQHVSRHVVDRDHADAISWNLAGARVRHRLADGVEAQLEAGRAMQRASVDYRWIARARVSARRPISGRVAMIAAATGDVMGVDEAVRGRSRVCGGRLEGGIRITGGAAALELFAGYERRVDAYATDRFRVRMFVAGFRILSR